jgi:hypothetical protein
VVEGAVEPLVALSCFQDKSVCVATTVVSIVILLLASSVNQVPIMSVTSTEILSLQSISIPSEAVNVSCLVASQLVNAVVVAYQLKSTEVSHILVQDFVVEAGTQVNSESE